MHLPNSSGPRSAENRSGEIAEFLLGRWDRKLGEDAAEEGVWSGVVGQCWGGSGMQVLKRELRKQLGFLEVCGAMA